MFSQLFALITGAAFGAILRHLFSLWFALGTLAANWLGAYLIGILAALLPLFPDLPPHWRLLLITGFLGSLTTFSGFSLEVITLLQAQRWGAALATASLHLFGSLALTVLGMATVHGLR